MDCKTSEPFLVRQGITIALPGHGCLALKRNTITLPQGLLWLHFPIMPMATLLASHWTSSASSKSPSHWRNSAGTTNCRIVSGQLHRSRGVSQIINTGFYFVFFFSENMRIEVCLEIYNVNSQTFGSILKHLSYTETYEKCLSLSVKHLEY